MKKINLIIGHRGVGKTSLLKRLDDYCVLKSISSSFFDLDDYIQQKENKTINQIFMEDGESIFRKLEKKYLNEIIEKSENNTFISVGAGYKGPYPQDCEVTFVRRKTDSNGRVFLNRPRLLSEVSPYDEYLELFAEREDHYKKHANKTLTLEEGCFNQHSYELEFFGLIPTVGLNCVFTLKNLQDLEMAKETNIKLVELRTDLLSLQDINLVFDQVTSEKVLLSLRDKDSLNSFEEISVDIKKDFALELGEPEQNYYILSLHNREATLTQTINKIEKYSSRAEILKLAIPIKNFSELKEAHDWHLLNPKKNCFLPMSDSGRWQWYRLLQQNKVFPNFIKFDSQGSALDQPFYYQWSKNNFEQLGGFAALLGHPVEHSYTPGFHYEYFKSKKMPVFNIPLKKEEVTLDSLNILSELGLKAAAVTSPLKIKIRNLVKENNFASINTLYFNNGQWECQNTDGVGLLELFKNLVVKDDIVLWGGQGVISEVKACLPQVSCYSSRQGVPKAGEQSIDQPQAIIWAVGRNNHKQWPNKNWQPKQVIDLNYSEDSPGKEYALMIGAKYVSGVSMFTHQALAQQKFWSSKLL